jgi:hypothetical protein
MLGGSTELLIRVTANNTLGGTAKWLLTRFMNLEFGVLMSGIAIAAATARGTYRVPMHDLGRKDVVPALA